MRMTSIRLKLEYWRLIVDKAFILTIQMEYAETPEQKELRHKLGHSRPASPYSLRTYLKAMLRPTMWGDGNVVAAVSRLFGLRISMIQGHTGDCNVTPIRHQGPLLKADVILIYNGRGHYTACRKGAITLLVVSNVF